MALFSSGRVNGLVRMMVVVVAVVVVVATEEEKQHSARLLHFLPQKLRHSANHENVDCTTTCGYIRGSIV